MISTAILHQQAIQLFYSNSRELSITFLKTNKKPLKHSSIRFQHDACTNVHAKERFHYITWNQLSLWNWSEFDEESPVFLLV
jgi:hypothetical protein